MLARGCSDQCSGYSCQHLGMFVLMRSAWAWHWCRSLVWPLYRMCQSLSPGTGFAARAPGLAGAEREEPNFSPNGLFLPRDPHGDFLIYIECCKYIWWNMHKPDFGRNGRVAHFGRKDLDYEVSCCGLGESIGHCTFFPVHMPKLLTS